MDLIYISNSRIPTEKAHGRQITDMCRLFSAFGVKVELVLPRRINNVFKGVSLFDYYKIEKTFNVKKIPAIDPRFLMKLPAGVYIKFQSLFFIFSLLFFLAIGSKKNKIIYTRDEQLLPILNVFSPNVFWECHALPRKIKFYLKAFSRCAGIIVLTKGIKKELVSLGIDDDKIIVAPDGVDLSIFDIDISKKDARLDLGLPQDKKIIGYTGAFKTKGMDKGLFDIIRSLKTIREEIDNILAVAVGGSQEDIDFYRSFAEKEGVDDVIVLLPKQDQHILAKYQKAFDLLLMPFPYKKHYAFYMSPLKMFEYMASKRPIISSDLPSIKEVLNDENAVFVRPGDYSDLAEKVVGVLSGAIDTSGLAQKAYCDVLGYTWEKRTENIVFHIKKISKIK